MYELFLELKQSFENRGNYYEAQKMKFIAYYFLNKVEKCNPFKSDFWNNKLVLTVNQFSNYHGISVRNAIWTSVFFIIIFHYLNVISYNTVEFSFISWENTYDVFSK
jgi:hypothetical protein